MMLYTVKILPNIDVVQTEARLARGRERRVLCGAAVFSRQRVLVMSADKSWAICKSSAVKIGAQRGAHLVVIGERCRSCSNEGGRQRFGGKANETRARGYYYRHVTRLHGVDTSRGVTWSVVHTDRLARFEEAGLSSEIRGYGLRSSVPRPTHMRSSQSAK